MSKIIVERVVLEQALEALEGEQPGWRTPAQERSIVALRAALVQQAEPKIGLSLDGTKWHGRLYPSDFGEPKQTSCDIAEDGVCEVIDCCRNPKQAAPWVKTYCGGKPNYTTPEEP